jgi:hypothetical protein
MATLIAATLFLSITHDNSLWALLLIDVVVVMVNFLDEVVRIKNLGI